MNNCRVARIRALNDEVRHHPRLGRWLITPKVQSHPALEAILERVRTFREFTNQNDPYHEHDFGSFEFDGETYFWKIDYYDVTLSMASPDPVDEMLTRRVLTIMHASEY
ncbi:MAG: DUF3768 domain-containing protein [Rhizomicrobium sp.]